MAVILQPFVLVCIIFANIVSAIIIPRQDLFALGGVPPAEFCLPSAHLTEMSGCLAMTEYLSQCRTFSTDEEKINCYCQQEMLSEYYK